LRFRAARRGFKEVDLLFGAFVAEFLDDLDEAGLDQFEALLLVPDKEVYTWLQDGAAVPEAYDTGVYRKLKSLCSRKSPKWNV